MSSTRLVDPRTYRRYRPDMGKQLIGPQGRGGPVPVDPHKQKPVNPPLQLPNPVAGLTDALGRGIQLLTTDVVSGGEVLIGVVLVLAGLMIATGMAGRTVHGAARVASRGVIR